MKGCLICYVLILWKKRDKFILLRNEVQSALCRMGMNSLKHLTNESEVIQICLTGNSRLSRTKYD